mgnify:CR=1 FL=1
MEPKTISELFAVGVADKEKNIAVLYDILKREDYKQTIRGAQLFLDNCADMLSEDCLFYWRAVALNLPNE